VCTIAARPWALIRRCSQVAPCRIPLGHRRFGPRNFAVLTSNGELKQSKGFGKTREILRLGVYALLVMLSLAVPIVFPVLVLSLNTVVQDPVLLPHTA